MWVTRKSIELTGLIVALTLLATACSSEEGSAGSTQASAEDNSSSELRSSETTIGESESEEVDGKGSDEPEVETAEDGFLEIVEVRTDLEESTSVDVLEVAGDDSELIVTFEMGSQQCNGVEATVDEQDDELIVNVHTGKLPEVSEACVEGVYPYQVAIPLEEPLQGRPVRQAEPEEPAEEPFTEPEAEALATGRPNVDHLLGLPVEEGVLWAINNEIEWQLTSYEGVAREVDGVDENRLSFEVESDKIVRIEWA